MQKTHVKEFTVTGSLNSVNRKMIMANFIPHVAMRAIYSFNSEIHRGVGQIVH